MNTDRHRVLPRGADPIVFTTLEMTSHPLSLYDHQVDVQRGEYHRNDSGLVLYYYTKQHNNYLLHKGSTTATTHCVLAIVSTQT